VIRSLRSRLFAAILGTVLLCVGVSLALGIVLTKNAVRDTIKQGLVEQVRGIAVSAPAAAPGVTRGPTTRRLVGPPGGVPSGLPPGKSIKAHVEKPGGPVGLVSSPDQAKSPTAVPSVISERQASRLLPAPALAAVRAHRVAAGTISVQASPYLFAARQADGNILVVSRPDVVSGSDFSHYLSGLLIASGLALLLSAALAVLISRGMVRPLRRVADASRMLAAGGSPEPIPHQSTAELAELGAAFNDMSAQLTRARAAERAVLLSVSHELRTPLTSIRGYAEGIEDGTVKPRDAARVVEREARRLERLVGDLLALARLRQGVLDVRSETVDLAVIARETAERLRPQAHAAGVQLRITEDGHAPAIGDHDRILQVASNLVENAIRVSEPGSEVTMSASSATLRVVDRGPGIPVDELPHTFERFHLRRRRGQGSPDGAGVGLAIVRELTEAMGGSVEVENLNAAGASFTVRLPSSTATPVSGRRLSV
jgi:signal transduction histidine kinase